MKALLKPQNEQVKLINIEKSLPNEYEVVIRVKSVGLCRTDLLVASGKIPVNKDIIIGHEFSGDVISGPSEWINKKVAVNPLYGINQFMGLQFNGSLQEEINVPVCQLIEVDSISYKVAAYLEPVAASMAILNAKLNKNEKGAIYGKNRIAELTFIIAKSAGLNVDWLDEEQSSTFVENTYDYIIETLFTENDLKIMFNILKPHGKLIIKSRKKQPVAIEANDLVAKNLTMQAVNYYDFHKAMQWLEINSSKVEHLLGDSYPIEQWESAFERANKGESTKIFIHFD